MVGHSLGGLATLAAAAEDRRIRAAVALDPVNPPRFSGVDAWNSAGEGPKILAPTLVIGAPSQVCNYFARYEQMVPSLGAKEKARIVVSQGSHCDFMMAYQLRVRDVCYRLCGGNYSEARVNTSARYTAAWLNYHLAGDESFYRYIYGDVAMDDLAAGVIQMDVFVRPSD
jgi:pimeloyl-ACP methyl ester carboxylesterase